MRKMIALLLLLPVLLSRPCFAQNAFASQSTGSAKNRPQLEADKADSVEVVRDLYSLHFQKLQSAAGNVWVLARVTPNPAFEQGQYMSPLRPLDQPEHGSLHFLSILAGTAGEDQEKYSWVIHYPIDDVGDYVRRKDAFANSAFSHSTGGGIVVCRINKSLPGEVPEGYYRYNPAYLLPSEYQSYVLPAFKFFGAHPGLIDEEHPTTKDAHQENVLRSLLHNGNPLLAAAALRALVSSNLLSGAEVTRYLERLQGIPLALSCYIVLKRTAQHQGEEDNGVKSLSSVISSATTTDRLQSVLTAVRAAELDTVPYGVPPTIQAVHTLLMDRQAALGGGQIKPADK